MIQRSALGVISKKLLWSWETNPESLSAQASFSSAAVPSSPSSKLPQDQPLVTTTSTLGEKNPACATISKGQLWPRLCAAGFVHQADAILRNGTRSLSIIQIGAHTGWDPNDPFTKGMTKYLESLNPDERQRVEYTFVEASPANYRVLEEKVKKNAGLCSFKTLHLGIIPDTQETSNLTFYSISDDINVDTGRDKRTGKKLHGWVTQISSFSKPTLLKHGFAWRRKGLNIEDYIVESHVPTLRFSEMLMQQQQHGQTLFVLVDTEGLDCSILRALSATSALPPLLLYEDRHCSPGEGKLTQEHLIELGYNNIQKIDNENVLVYRA